MNYAIRPKERKGYPPETITDIEDVDYLAFLANSSVQVEYLLC